ncbi:MAG TPA: metallophosphoesterase, partial [Myxococcaceae bacterium]|nr:metallophosphoesterase [Myxococcaceae bacterium]
MPAQSEVLVAPAPPRAAPPRRPPGRKMVRWFAPGVFALTGVRAVISATIGKQADRRVLDALAVPGPEAVDLSVDEAGRPREELWLDYVSDLGDGWDSTYEVAREVARRRLVLRDEQGQEHETAGGEVLVFGGDEVYPTANLREYEERTVRPWEAAFRGQRPRPHLFAVPGNHDWYDGLVSFSRLFCQGRALPAWVTHQRRSYFAAKLPHGWWLIGLDMQLESDIDEPQVEYFQQLCEREMGEGDRIILCLAEPAWLLEQVRPPRHRGRSYLENNLDFLERAVFRRRVSVFLAGDIHHYRRHAHEDGRQKVIAGGGGAFLHPTHHPKRSRPLVGGFTEQKCYPSASVSRRLCWRNLGFLGRNPTFGLLTGALYVVLSWAFLARGAQGGNLLEVLLEPGVLLVAGLLVLGLIGFADERFGRWRWLAGLVHGLAHGVAAFLLAWGALWLTGSVLGMEPASAWRDLVGALVVFAGGFVVGPTLMGVYLLISLNAFGAHPNEAFSSLACPDWKNFIRMKIDRDGKLWLYPVGIQRVPRRWKPGATVR